MQFLKNHQRLSTLAGRVVFDYQESDSQFLYFGYNRGLKAGGYNPAEDVMTATVSML